MLAVRFWCDPMRFGGGQRRYRGTKCAVLADADHESGSNGRYDDDFQMRWSIEVVQRAIHDVPHPCLVMLAARRSEINSGITPKESSLGR